jgi:hypothetical protein
MEGWMPYYHHHLLPSPFPPFPFLLQSNNTQTKQIIPFRIRRESTVTVQIITEPASVLPLPSHINRLSPIPTYRFATHQVRTWPLCAGIARRIPMTQPSTPLTGCVPMRTTTVIFLPFLSLFTRASLSSTYYATSLLLSIMD